MTDSEAVRTYKSARRFVRIREKYPSKIPVQYPPTKGDLDALERARELDQRAIREPLQTMQQAEKAISRLPLKEWREIMGLIYLEDLHVWETANETGWSDRSVFEILRRAFHYLDTGEILGRVPKE